ncbi:MAG: HD domain-containing protein, partial [Desulfobacterales bacterium]|nr:HD domain-containing protein [Desulfobacterales bacterium]
IYCRLHDWLLAHIQSFAIADEAARRHFDLKRTHSLKVAEEIDRLGRALGLASRPLLIARVIGLLHDAGRFEQYDRYRTYNDAASMDHGALGAAIVSSNGLLAAFDSSEAQAITQAILHHNKVALPENLSSEALFFLKLIRDADKLDIYRIIMENMAAADQALFKVLLPGNEDASEELAAILMRGDGVNYQLARNATDRLLMHVGWVFDINFRPTLRAIAHRGYLETIATALPPTPRVTQIITKARNHLAAALSDGPLSDLNPSAQS